MIWPVLISYMRDRETWYDIANMTELLHDKNSWQLVQNQDLVHKSFLVMDIISNFNGVNDYITWLETNIKMILYDEGNHEVFRAKDTAATTANINKMTEKIILLI